MKVLTVASRKGGSGKTTIAGHLAVQAELDGYGNVGLIDVDPQGSMAEWWNARAAATPVYVQTALHRVVDDVNKMRDTGLDLLVLDTPPSLSKTVSDIVSVSDLIIVPVRPSPHDLRSVGTTVGLIEHLGKPLIFVVNGAAPRARITAEAVEALSQHGPLAPTIVHQRVDFAASMIDGRTVMELAPKSRSAAEIRELWSYVKERLEVGARPQFLPSLPKPPPKPLSAPVVGLRTLHA